MLLPLPSQETAGFADDARWLDHNFGNLPLQTSRFVSEPANRVSHSALRILKWNADGLSTKVHELRQRLQLEKIDLCLIKETKLTSKDPTPAFPGFSAVRQGRPASHRGKKS